MKRLLLPLLAALALPVSVNAKESFNYESICTLTSEYNSNYTIEIYHDAIKKLGILYYEDEPKFSLTFDYSNGYGRPFFLIEKFNTEYNSFHKDYYPVTRIETDVWRYYRSGSYISFFGDIPLREYMARSEKEQKKVKGNARILLMDLPNAFYYLWRYQEERNQFLALRDGEWERVAKNFWEKDKKNCTDNLYKFL